MWVGSTRKHSHGRQVYYTPPKLAESVVGVALEWAPLGAVFLEVGVGEGALFRLLPSPKKGIEVRRKPAGRGVPGVEYGTDVMKWSPPASWEGRDVVVVLYPPFNRQVEILNRCARMRCRSRRVVWIAGLNVRHWDTEDKIDPRMHLCKEWLVPPGQSVFETKVGGEKRIRTVVQVWERKEEERRLWKDVRFGSPGGSGGFATSKCADANAVVTQVNSWCQVGAAGWVGKDVVIKGGDALLTEKGRRLRGSSSPCRASRAGRAGGGGGDGAGPSLGTVRTETRGGAAASQTSGTAVCIRADRPRSFVGDMNSARKSGRFEELLRYRSPGNMVSISERALRRMLSPQWKKLIRKITFLDGVRRSKHQW